MGGERAIREVAPRQLGRGTDLSSSCRAKFTAMKFGGYGWARGVIIVSGSTRQYPLHY